MIKQVDEIPKNQNEKRRSYRQQITDDIKEAIESGITKFEFDGDYNWKYLAQYAKEQADHVLELILRKKWAETHRNTGYPHHYDRHIRDIKYIKIHNIKQPDRNHVYCEIIPDALDEMMAAHEKYREDVEKRRAGREAEKAARQERVTKKTDVHNLVKIKEAEDGTLECD